MCEMSVAVFAYHTPNERIQTDPKIVCNLQISFVAAGVRSLILSPLSNIMALQ